MDCSMGTHNDVNPSLTNSSTSGYRGRSMRRGGNRPSNQNGPRRVSTSGRGNRDDSSNTANLVSGRAGRPNLLDDSRGPFVSSRGRAIVGAGRGGHLHNYRNLTGFRGSRRGAFRSNVQPNLTNSYAIGSISPSSAVGNSIQQLGTYGVVRSQNVSGGHLSRLNERSRNTCPLGFAKLKEYMAGSSSELVLHLTCGQAFELLLNSDSVKVPNKPGIVFEDTILAALAKAFDSKLSSVRENQNELLSRVLKSTYFRSTLTNQISEWLVNVAAVTPESRPVYVANINNCCIVLFNLMELRHSTYSSCAANVTLLKTLFETLKTGYFDIYNKMIDEQLATSHNNMVEKFDELLVRHQEKSNKVMTSRIFLLHEDEPPPNDFRELSIVPTAADINTVKCDYLRSNRIKGRYDDVDHYLDLQFRLLREDCICPVRRGVQISFESEFQLADGYSKEYIMAESGAYFEAYRHVLTGLQKMPVDGFPMERYLVHCQTDLRTPAYLRHEGVAIDDLDEDVIMASPKYKMQLKTSTSVPQQSVMFDVLDPLKWPSNNIFGLDERQYDALKLAITSEFALIQGPPGTGKTFIGYKIVQLLLDNSHVWSDTQPSSDNTSDTGMTCDEVTDTSPILVLCYTNHALDQFLEGVALFMPEGIIRVGGRCKNEKLNRYLLREVVRASQSELPPDIRRQFYSIRDKKLEIDKKIQEASIRRKMPSKNIMRYDYFKSYMTRAQISCFEQYVIKVNRYRRQCDCDNALWDWLFHDFQFGIVASPAKVKADQNDVSDNISDDDSESIDYADIGRNRYLDDDYGDDWHGHETFKERQARVEAELARYSTSFEAASKLDAHKMDGRIGGDVVKKREKYIKEMLTTDQDSFNSDEAKTKIDVWRLSHDDRWKLYRYWVNCFVAMVSQRLNTLQGDQIILQKQLDELRQYEQLQVLRNATIIGMTTTGAAKYQGLLQEVGAKIIIIEEAAEVLEGHLVTSLSSKCEHLILIGDHFQLRPNPAVYELAKKYKLEISLFERMINNGIKCATLAFQHRMRPEIADLLMPHFYNELHNADNVYKYPDVKGMAKNMFFIQHSHNEANEGDTTSHKNDYESKYLVNLCRYLLQQGYTSDQITILTPYTGQMFNLKCQMEKIIPKNGVRISPVDSYQGEENDIILLSLVRSNKEMKIGFMNTKNRVCVALSRAKLGLYVIGNFDLFAEVNKEFWAPICNDLKKQSVLSNELEICCQIHKEVRVVKCPSDFEKLAPDGGCVDPCGYRMDCGHVCPQMCHPVDVEHTNVNCRQVCSNKCTRDFHICKRICYQCKDGCPPCKINISVSISICGHEISSIKCGTPDDEIKCPEPCPKKLPCGHKCPNKCGDPCVVKCKEKVKVLLSKCGHEASMTCGTPEYQIKCSEPCPKKLSCGHKCLSMCGYPCAQCKEKVKVSLSKCGHEVSMTCGTPEYQIKCSEPCHKKLSCGHDCLNMCGYTCFVKCMEKTEKLRNPCGHLVPLICHQNPDDEFCLSKLKKIWPLCGHENETRCSTNSSVDPCRHKCDALLECGHACSGTCYECYQGRLHKRCDRDCGRILICGHVCKAKCCITACPPCERSCVQKCKHNRYSHSGRKLHKRTCGQSCPPCKQKCGWRCGVAINVRTATHDVVACSKKCDEICDRPSCDMPCPIARPYRKCNHRCPGLCGEKCPPCRRCQPKKFPMDAISSKPYPDDARFLLLPECNHVVEVTTMDKWMKDDDVESTNVQSNEIVMKGCYQCKTPVLTVNRYNQIIKSKLADVEMVKIKMHKNGKDLVQHRADLLVLVRDPLFNTDIHMVSNETRTVLLMFIENVEIVQDDHLTQHKMAQWSNFAAILKEVSKNVKSIVSFSSGYNRQRNTIMSISSTLPKLGEFLKLWCCFFMGIPASCTTVPIKRLLNDHLRRQLDNLTRKLGLILRMNTTLSDQYQAELFLEVQRFSPIIDLVQFCFELVEKKKDLKRHDDVNSGSGSLQHAPARHNGSHTSGPDFQLAHGILTYLYGNKPLTYDRIEKIEMGLIELKKRCGSNLAVRRHEKQEIVKALGLGKGHWYGCGNGHVYAIGEYGGAFQDANCPECDNKMGAVSQTLLTSAGNQSSPEMDEV